MTLGAMWNFIKGTGLAYLESKLLGTEGLLKSVSAFIPSFFHSFIY
jgi:hypothetical protein